MGNVGGCCWVRGGTLDTCNCCDWWQDSIVSSVGIFIWRFLRFIFWCLIRAIDFIATVFQVIWTFISSIYPFFFYFALVLAISWLWWFTYPYTGPYVGQIAVPLINLAFELFVFAWYLFVMLWDLAVRVYNALVPLLGMLLYIAMEIFLTVLHEVVNILGEINIYSLMKPLMEVINILTKVFTEVAQVIVKVGKPLLELLAKVVGPILNIYFSVLEIYIKIYGWLYETLFRLLEPTLNIVLSIVSWFTSWQAAAFKFGRALQGLGDAADEDDFANRIFGKAGETASKYWNDPRVGDLHTRELQHINDYLDRHPLHSFGYYYTIMRPYTQAWNTNYFSKEFYAGEPDEEQIRGNTRHLLSHGRARVLLTLEEREVFDKPAVEFEEFWERFAEDPGAAHTWYHAKVQAHNDRKSEIFGRVVRKLAESNDPALNATIAGKVPKQAKPADPWAADLHKKIPCKSHACKGKSLVHPVLALRKKHWERAELPREQIPWKEPDETDEEYERRSVVHLSTWALALQTAHEEVIEPRLNDPRLWNAAADAWKRITGHESAHSAYEEFSQSYADGYHLVYDNLCSMTDWGILRWAKSLDPERHSRPYCSDFKDTVKVQVREDPNRPGRKLAEFVLEPEERQDHRALLELALKDVDHPARRQLLSVALDQGWSRWVSDTTRRVLLGFERDPLTGHAYRRLHADFFGGTLPGFVDNSTAIKEDLADRNQRLESQKPVRSATLPLWELLSGTDCYTTTPRNPLCLPEIPVSWIIRKVPRITWPEELDGDDSVCAPLYCLPPRDALDWRAYISWCWIENGITSVKLIISEFFYIFTDTVGFFKATYSWVGWIFSPFLAIKPGAQPSRLDWACFAIHFYGMVLDAFLLWALFTLVAPFISWFFRSVASFVAFYETFVMADELRRERRKDTAHRFYNAAYDSDMNPGVRYFNDPDYFTRSMAGRRPVTLDFNGHVRDPQQFSDPQSAANEWAPSAGRYHRSSFMPWHGQNRYERYNAVSPYHINPETGYRLPWNGSTTENSGEATLIGDSIHDAHWPQNNAIDANLARETERIDRSSGGDAAEQSRRRAEERHAEVERLVALQELAQLEQALNEGVRVFGTWRYTVTSDHLLAFERIFRYMLHSFQMSFWWSVQYGYAEMKRRKIRFWYSPTIGEYRPGFTRYTQNDLTNALYPNDVPSFAPNAPRDMNV